MSIRLNASSVRLAAGALALAATGGSPPAAAAVPSSAAWVTVKENARIREAGSTTHANSRIRVSAGVTPGVKPQSLSVTLAGFTLDVPLKNGRFSGSLPLGTGRVTVEVATRRGRLDATFRSRVRDG